MAGSQASVTPIAGALGVRVDGVDIAADASERLVAAPTTWHRASPASSTASRSRATSRTAEGGSTQPQAAIVAVSSARNPRGSRVTRSQVVSTSR